jgi:O-antigen ligase
MDLASASPTHSPVETRQADWSFFWPWLLGFGLTAYLGLSGGGFDILVSGQVGIAVWWVLLLAVAVGALPRRRPGPLALCLLGLLAAFVLWTGLSLRWTESTEKTAIDLARVATYLGIFALGIASGGGENRRHLVNAVGAGIVLVAIIALLSRLEPSWFPAAAETGKFLATGRERLSYPLDYWNSLAALIAVGLPIAFQNAHGARLIAVRGLAAAALPAMILALFFTLSRSGMAAALIALGVFLVFTRDRLPQFLGMALAAAGGGFLIVLALGRDELVHGVTDAAGRSQGEELLWITIAVCLLVGLAQTAIAYARAPRPRWTVVSRRQSLTAVAVAVGVVIVALLAVNAPGRLSDAWDNFKEPTGHSEKGTSRLTSSGGENRYQLWSSAAREFDSEPLTGTGSGTFQLWWTRDGDVAEPIVDTHSLYLQVLGELGLVGLLVLLAFIVTALVAGARRTLAADADSRPLLAAALAGSTVLWAVSIFDWTWKIPVVPAATLLLLAALLMPSARSAPRGALSPPLRFAVGAVSVFVLVMIAIPLASNALVRQSQSQARDGDFEAALSSARSAQNAEPGAAGPRVQQALLLESNGELPAAAAAATAATEREPTNWHTWLLLSRIEAQREHPAAALTAYRQARSLYPNSPLFVRGR